MSRGILLSKGLFFLLLSFVFRCHLYGGTDEKQWLFPVVMESGVGIIELPDTAFPSAIYFLRFGHHSFEPDSAFLEREVHGRWEKIADNNSILIDSPISIGLFQELKAVPWSLPAGLWEKGFTYRFKVKRMGGVNGEPARDSFWDQIIRVRESEILSEKTTGLRNFTCIEAGKFGEALPSHIREISFSPAEIEQQKECLTDPVMDVLKKVPQQEISWKEIESKAFPLDYQKILLSGINDPDPGFAYQNGQWFVTRPGNDGFAVLAEWSKKTDNWFAPAVRLGKEIIRPAPLSAKTMFFENKDGRFLPLLILEWTYPTAEQGGDKNHTKNVFRGNGRNSAAIRAAENG